MGKHGDQNESYQEDIPLNESPKSEESLSSDRRPDNLEGNDVIQSADEESYSSSSSEEDYDYEKNMPAFDVNQIHLRDEFHRFTTYIRDGTIASPQVVNYWIELSDVSADLYLDGFTVTELRDMITLFLYEILNNTIYKYPCLAILVKWALNLRQSFFDFYGYNLFGYCLIIPIFEIEWVLNPNNELLLAINSLRMPMI